MDQNNVQRSGNRAPIGEALIVIAVIIGFFWAFLQGKIVLQGFWAYTGFLGAIVAFYFALLICRIAYFHATGGGTPWWVQQEKWEAMEKRKK